MKEIFGHLIVLQLVLVTCVLHGAGEFKRIDQWKHDEVLGFDCLSFVNSGGQLVGSFYRCGPRIITPEKITIFAPRGQGPNEMSNILAAFPYKNDLLAFEYMGKTKIFTPKNGTYVYKETKWFKMGKYGHVVKEGIFFDGKFFLSGLKLLDYNSSDWSKFARLVVFDETGKPLKDLLEKEYTTKHQFHLMNYHLAGYKSDKVLFLPANELRVSIISSQKFDVLKEVNLEVPDFYKSMPKDFYAHKMYNNPKDNFQLDIETWAMGYSVISEVAVDGNFLVVQIRTCREKLKKFALLFYNIENNFKLERTVFTNDFLLDIKDGKYYCFANGNPGRDEDTDECIINIYSWK